MRVSADPYPQITGHGITSRLPEQLPGKGRDHHHPFPTSPLPPQAVRHCLRTLKRDRFRYRFLQVTAQERFGIDAQQNGTLH